jgi:hypothetical protein
VFLGYNNRHKGFKCLDIASSHIYISRDVVFDDTCFPFTNLHSTAGSRYTSEVLIPQPPSPGNITDLPLINMPNPSHLLPVSSSVIDAAQP